MKTLFLSLVLIAGFAVASPPSALAVDYDGDGVVEDDGLDNCPNVANPGQLNTDGDSEGDACDNDDDGDGIPDTQDPAPLDSSIP